MEVPPDDHHLRERLQLRAALDGEVAGSPHWALDGTGPQGPGQVEQRALQHQGTQDALRPLCELLQMVIGSDLLPPKGAEVGPYLLPIMPR